MQNKQIQEPELNDVLNAHKTEILRSINCINIGTIQSFDETKQTAQIQLCIKKIVEIKPDGTKILKDRPALAQVPIVVLGGTSNVRVPIRPGDIALIFFNDRDIDNWWSNCSGSAPNTLRLHDLSDAIAITGLHNLTNSISDYLNDRISIYFDSSDKIEVLSGLVNIITTLCKVDAKLQVTGDTQLDAKLDVTGAAKMSSTLDVTGAIKGSAMVEGAQLKAGNGASIVKLSPPSTITVVNGIVTSIT